MSGANPEYREKARPDCPKCWGRGEERYQAPGQPVRMAICSCRMPESEKARQTRSLADAILARLAQRRKEAKADRARKQPPGPFEKGLRRARSTLQREGKRT